MVTKARVGLPRLSVIMEVGFPIQAWQTIEDIFCQKGVNRKETLHTDKVSFTRETWMLFKLADIKLKGTTLLTLTQLCVFWWKCLQHITK